MLRCARKGMKIYDNRYNYRHFEGKIEVNSNSRRAFLNGFSIQNY
jgi:hypothetical protein